MMHRTQTGVLYGMWCREWVRLPTSCVHGSPVGRCKDISCRAGSSQQQRSGWFTGQLGQRPATHYQNLRFSPERNIQMSVKESCLRVNSYICSWESNQQTSDCGNNYLGKYICVCVWKHNTWHELLSSANEASQVCSFRSCPQYFCETLSFCLHVGEVMYKYHLIVSHYCSQFWNIIRNTILNLTVL